MSKKNTEAKVIEATTTEVQVDPRIKEIESIVNDSNRSKSQKIRELHVIFGADNKARSHVAKVLNIRYQHVRNVLVTPLKKA